MLTSPEIIEKEARRVLDGFGKGTGHIFNLGHGITPDVPPNHVATLIKTVHEYSRIFHESVD